MYSVLFVVVCFSASCILLHGLSYFFVLPTKIAEAGTKSDMSYLDAPDA